MMPSRAQLLRGLLLGCLSIALIHAHAAPASASAAGRSWSFGILGQPERKADGEEHLRQMLEASQQERLAFVVASGIKSAAEPCTDALYEQRLELLEQSRHPLFLSLSAPDWAECRREDGRSAAQDRLARMRDLFFANVGRNPALPVAQQSQIAQYRDFAENLRWEMRGVMFATINLPGDNNHYVPDAGRNSEFEDRMIANRHWLQRLLRAAKSHRSRTLVLFFDADPQIWHTPHSVAEQRDGYAEVRRQLRELSSKFNGKLLLVHQGDGRAKPGLRWRGNVGELVPWPGLTRVSVQSRGNNFQAAKAD
jgi:hypothetical protein